METSFSWTAEKLFSFLCLRQSSSVIYLELVGWKRSRVAEETDQKRLNNRAITTNANLLDERWNEDVLPEGGSKVCINLRADIVATMPAKSTRTIKCHAYHTNNLGRKDQTAGHQTSTLPYSYQQFHVITIPIQRRFGESNPLTKARKEVECVSAEAVIVVLEPRTCWWRPFFAPFPIVTLPFRLDTCLDEPADALVLFAIASRDRDDCVRSTGPSTCYSIPCCFLSCSKLSLRDSRSSFDLTILSGWW